MYMEAFMIICYTTTNTWPKSALQQHVLFFDRDGDGMISPWDTYIGFRDLGFNVIFSFLAMLVINLNFSYPTRLAHSYIPDPMFRVYVHGIHKVKVGGLWIWCSGLP